MLTNMPFGKKNYVLMLIGVGIICLGFIIMSMDGEKHGFGFLGLTLGPLTLLAGFVFQFYAIFAKSEPVASHVQESPIRNVRAQGGATDPKLAEGSPIRSAKKRKTKN